EPNRKFFPGVEAAYEEAKAEQVGMFSPDLACTFASRVQEYADSVAAVEGSVGSISPEETQASADVVVAAGVSLLALVDASAPGSLEAAGLTAVELDVLRARVTALQGQAEAVSAAAAEEAERVKAEEEAERKAAEEARKVKEEAERKAKEEA